MNKKLVLGAVIAGIILSVFLFISINGMNSSQKSSQNRDNIIDAIKDETSTTSESSQDNVNENFINPLTGLSTEENMTERRPIAIMLDNQYNARPQAALSEADVVYEILAEGLITRYMAIFYGNMPEHVGPVRSSRPYFVEKAMEFDPYYVHVGGSMQALSDIKAYEIADIDGLSSSAFWRETHKKAPHNMYTSSEVLIADAIRLKYDVSKPVTFLPFNPVFTPLTGQDAVEITFVYKEPVKNDPVGYYTSYKYNDEKKLYFRYTNGTPHLDENTQTQLTCTNILVQYADIRVLDNEGRLDVDLVTSGKGTYYTGGKMIDVTWSKKSAQAITEFFDASGSPIKLNPGVTWFQIMKTGNKESIK